MDAWSKQELDLIVAEYFAMLTEELAGRTFNKTQRRQQLLPQLHRRSEAAIEFTYANISAVLQRPEISLPYIRGYKPRHNYQKDLVETILLYLNSAQGLQVYQKLDSELNRDPAMVTPPTPEQAIRLNPPPKIQETPSLSYQGAVHFKIDYVAREQDQLELALAGERWVMQLEQIRLSHLGRPDLARRIEHVALTSDKEGFDIRSFERTGRERLIKIKTTRFGEETPFYTNNHELDVSTRYADTYHLYRLYDFRQQPSLYVIGGDLSARLKLQPVIYMATPR